MATFTNFSRHAFERMQQRTQLTVQDISRFLDRGLAVDTGSEPGFNRHHLVFYSQPDNNFFVAVRDGQSGTVVTVLPMNYHEHLAWKISDEDCEKARSLQLAALALEHARATAVLQPKTFVISVNYTQEDGGIKHKIVHRFVSAVYKESMMRLLNDPLFMKTTLAAAAEHGITKGSIAHISIRYGAHGDPVIVDMDDSDQVRAKWQDVLEQLAVA